MWLLELCETEGLEIADLKRWEAEDKGMLRLDWSRVLQVRSVSNYEELILGFPMVYFPNAVHQ